MTDKLLEIAAETMREYAHALEVGHLPLQSRYSPHALVDAAVCAERRLRVVRGDSDVSRDCERLRTHRDMEAEAAHYPAPTDAEVLD